LLTDQTKLSGEKKNTLLWILNRDAAFFICILHRDTAFLYDFFVGTPEALAGGIVKKRISI
jgi:hypothetical protein